MTELQIAHRANLVLLFDLYGGLLTEKQQTMFDLYYQMDLSLGEIAEEQGVSRQAVFDILKRTEKTLEEYEAKLKLAEKEYERRHAVEQLARSLTGRGMTSEEAAYLQVLGWEE